MESKEYIWPEGESITFIRPPVEEYHGKLDYFYSPDAFPELAPLKENWEGIRNEILAIEKRDGLLSGMNSLSPAKIEGQGSWSLIYLMSFRWKFHKNMKKFPFTTSVISQIPNCVFAGISTLPPNTEIKPHYGDTNAIVRTHLGLIIPEPYPTIGIRVGDQERGWKDGELLCFINVQKHNVWNNSSKRRYVLMFDFIPQPLVHKTNEICSNALGSQSFIFFYKRFALVQKLPTFVHNWMCKIFSIIWKVYLPIQRRFEFL
jgi:hypothetical protein